MLMFFKNSEVRVTFYTCFYLSKWKNENSQHSKHRDTFLFDNTRLRKARTSSRASIFLCRDSGGDGVGGDDEETRGSTV